MHKLFTLLDYSPWDYNSKIYCWVFCYISLSHISLFYSCLWTESAGKYVVFPVNIVLITSACQKTGNSNFCKFLTGYHSVFKEVKKYLIGIHWGKWAAKSAGKVIWAFRPLMRCSCVTPWQSSMEEQKHWVILNRKCNSISFYKMYGVTLKWAQIKPYLNIYRSI